MLGGGGEKKTAFCNGVYIHMYVVIISQSFFFNYWAFCLSYFTSAAL